MMAVAVQQEHYNAKHFRRTMTPESRAAEFYNVTIHVQAAAFDSNIDLGQYSAAILQPVKALGI